MSFNPMTGLVYLPAQEIQGGFAPETKFEYVEGQWNLGIDLGLFAGFNRKLASGHLLAWDPVKGREAWRAQYKTPWNGGTLIIGDAPFDEPGGGGLRAQRGGSEQRRRSGEKGDGREARGRPESAPASVVAGRAVVEPWLRFAEQS